MAEDEVESGTDGGKAGVLGGRGVVGGAVLSGVLMLEGGRKVWGGVGRLWRSR